MSSMMAVSLFLPQFVSARALGISVQRDCISLAFMNENGLADVETFAHKASAVFKNADPDAEFRDQVNPLQHDTQDAKLGALSVDVKRILYPAIEKVALVGFASTDLPMAPKKTAAVFYDIKNTDLNHLLQPGGKMTDDSFLNGMNAGDSGRKLRAEIVNHFYKQLGKERNWNAKGVRLDAALAVARAFVALEMARAARGKV
jgi:hypothetical protein